MTDLLARIPHRGPMCFLDAVVAVDAQRVHTRTTLRPDFLLLRDGAASPMIAIELFAQTAAVFMANRAAHSDQPFVEGALLGARMLDATVDRLLEGDVLEIFAEEVFGAGNLAQFKCRLERDGETIATGNINVASGAAVVRG